MLLFPNRNVASWIRTMFSFLLDKLNEAINIASKPRHTHPGSEIRADSVKLYTVQYITFTVGLPIRGSSKHHRFRIGQDHQDDIPCGINTSMFGHLSPCAMFPGVDRGSADKLSTTRTFMPIPKFSPCCLTLNFQSYDSGNTLLRNS